MSEHSREHPRLRVAVVVVREGELLLVRHQKGERTYWLLPGGGLDYGETFAECATRELREETGLEIEIERCLYLSEGVAPDKSRHIVHVTLLGRLVGGTLTKTDEAVVAEVAWVPVERLRDLTLFPAIQEALEASHAAAFDHDMRYLGALWS